MIQNNETRLRGSRITNDSYCFSITSLAPESLNEAFVGVCEEVESEMGCVASKLWGATDVNLVGA